MENAQPENARGLDAIGSVLLFQDLQELCKPGEHPRVATVEAWAKRIGLRYTYDGQGGLISSTDALNAALGLRNDDAYPTDIV